MYISFNHIYIYIHIRTYLYICSYIHIRIRGTYLAMYVVLRTYEMFQTKKMDIFSAGCIFYYVLTRGKHPFGDNMFLRPANILRRKFTLRALSGHKGT